MAEGTSPNIGDLFGGFGTNPFNAFAKTFEQLKKGAGDMIAAVEMIRSTMENLNSAATRMNRMLDDVEEPIRAAMPQITRAVKLANGVVDQIAGPVERVAPGINRLADTLSSPVMTTMPKQLGDFLDSVSDLSKRLAPLTQLAESAGGLFGMRGFTIGTLSGRQSPSESSAESAGEATPEVKAPKATRTTAKQWATSTGARTPATKKPARTATAKKATAKKATAKKATARKSTSKKATAKKTPARTNAARTTATKKAATAR